MFFQDLATSWLYLFVDRPNHCCLSWHRSLTSCWYNCSRSQLWSQSHRVEPSSCQSWYFIHVWTDHDCPNASCLGRFIDQGHSLISTELTVMIYCSLADISATALLTRCACSSSTLSWRLLDGCGDQVKEVRAAVNSYRGRRGGAVAEPWRQAISFQSRKHENTNMLTAVNLSSCALTFSIDWHQTHTVVCFFLN